MLFYFFLLTGFCFNFCSANFSHCQIERAFGPKFLLELYVAGALGGSIFYLMHKALMAIIQGTMVMSRISTLRK